jgi:hypothetical protein
LSRPALFRKNIEARVNLTALSFYRTKHRFLRIIKRDDAYRQTAFLSEPVHSLE